MAFRTRNTRGFTLIELMVVVGILGILASIALPIYASGQATKGWIAQAERDGRVFATAVESFQKEIGRLPSNLDELATGPTVNAKNQLIVGPVLKQLPKPPRGWTYTYQLDSPKGTFTIVATGDGKTLVFPRPSTR